MFKKLEEIKKIGAYNVQLYYGENIGCDDSGVKPEERSVIVLFYPVGALGEVKIMWRGRAKNFDSFDFKTKPKPISNPPKEDEYKNDGYYIFGVERSVLGILNKPFFEKWN